MKKTERLNQEIDELSKIKKSINEIKRNYQIMNNNLEMKKDVRKMIDILDKIYILIILIIYNYFECMEIFICLQFLK